MEHGVRGVNGVEKGTFVKSNKESLNCSVDSDILDVAELDLEGFGLPDTDDTFIVSTPGVPLEATRTVEKIDTQFEPSSTNQNGIRSSSSTGSSAPSTFGSTSASSIFGSTSSSTSSIFGSTVLPAKTMLILNVSPSTLSPQIPEAWARTSLRRTNSTSSLTSVAKSVTVPVVSGGSSDEAEAPKIPAVADSLTMITPPKNILEDIRKRKYKSPTPTSSRSTSELRQIKTPSKTLASPSKTPRTSVTSSKSSSSAASTPRDPLIFSSSSSIDSVNTVKLPLAQKLFEADDGIKLKTKRMGTNVRPMNYGAVNKNVKNTATVQPMKVLPMKLTCQSIQGQTSQTKPTTTAQKSVSVPVQRKFATPKAASSPKSVAAATPTRSRISMTVKSSGYGQQSLNRTFDTSVIEDKVLNACATPKKLNSSFVVSKHVSPIIKQSNHNRTFSTTCATPLQSKTLDPVVKPPSSTSKIPSSSLPQPAAAKPLTKLHKFGFGFKKQ